MSTPMTAEEIRKEWQASAQNPVAVAWLLEWMLDWMSARERRDAELDEMKRQIGEMGAKLIGDGR